MDPIFLRDRITGKTMEFGADAAGVCLASHLLGGPTHSRFPLPEGMENGCVIVVFAISHPPEKPELDYFIRKEGFRFGNSIGNRRLMDISERLGRWLGQWGIVSRDLHYYVERGGVFLKDAAVLAGLGVMGLNNLFIHPGYGPRIRLRARLAQAAVAPSDAREFDPCSGCSRPCLANCPEGAFDENGYLADRCQARLDRDYEEGKILHGEADNKVAREVIYCRACELSCSYVGTLER